MRIALLLVLAAVPALAADPPPPSLYFEGCVDAHGEAVAARAVPGQAAFVASRAAADHAELLYNPDALPARKDLTRAFLFAQACARHNLGYPALEVSPEQARRADCWGLATLLRSGLISDEAGVAAIQADLDLSPAEWSRLPGPPRSFDLGACYREALRLPSAAPPAADQSRLNACLHGCGDRLFRCQGGSLSTAGACMTAFDSCEAACGK